ncbi:MAG: LysE family translocator [Vicinamibacterales bacterium]|nr:LysE family translocator [Vicinamibacterales bacterium]
MLPLPPASIVAFSGVAALLVLAPGMSTAVVLRNTAEGGKRAGLATALGIALGNTAWAVAAGAGLGVVLGNAPGALDVIRIVGGLCLTWLGARSLGRAWAVKSGQAHNGAGAAPRTRARAAGTRVGEGAVTNLLNPSIPVFYAATVPQFIGTHDPFVTAFLLLGAIHVSMALACHSLYAVAFGQVATALAARGRAWVLHAATGAALIALAALSVRSLFA